MERALDLSDCAVWSHALSQGSILAISRMDRSGLTKHQHRHLEDVHHVLGALVQQAIETMADLHGDHDHIHGFRLPWLQVAEAQPERLPVAAKAERFDEAVIRELRQALEATGGRIHSPRGAAAQLGLKPTTLQCKLCKYGLARYGKARDSEE